MLTMYGLKRAQNKSMVQLKYRAGMLSDEQGRSFAAVITHNSCEQQAR